MGTNVSLLCTQQNNQGVTGMSDLGDAVERYVNDKFPKGVSVPTGVSEDEAIRSVQEQFRDAGFGCPQETARGLVQEAWRRAG
jgi:hypothetical protein